MKRIRIIEGHIGGIYRMVEEEKYCIDIIRQIHAVQSALNKVTSKILEEHLNTCLISAVRGENEIERARVLKEISDIFETAIKV